VRRTIENLFAFLLRHAAQHAKHFPLPRLALELLEAVEHLLFGLVANRARVVQHQFGVFRRFHLRQALADKRADHLLGIVHIHLAAKRLDVEGFHA
jgi:hypothetical protein